MEHHAQNDHVLRHNWITIVAACQPRFLPATSTQTPFAACGEADRTQIVAARSRKIEKLIREYPGHGVVTGVLGANAAVTVPVEARHRRLAERGEGLFKD